MWKSNILIMIINTSSCMWYLFKLLLLLKVLRFSGFFTCYSYLWFCNASSQDSKVYQGYCFPLVKIIFSHWSFRWQFRYLWTNLALCMPSLWNCRSDEALHFSSCCWKFLNDIVSGICYSSLWFFSASRQGSKNFHTC